MAEGFSRHGQQSGGLLCDGKGRIFGQRTVQRTVQNQLAVVSFQTVTVGQNIFDGSADGDKKITASFDFAAAYRKQTFHLGKSGGKGMKDSSTGILIYICVEFLRSNHAFSMYIAETVSHSELKS